jgi:hypothetical protein
MPIANLSKRFFQKPIESEVTDFLVSAGFLNTGVESILKQKLKEHLVFRLG